MFTISAICKTLFALFTVIMITQTVYSERRNIQYVTTIWSRFRVSMLFEVIGVLAQTILIYCLLSWISPIFDYGWVNIFFQESGNIYITPITDVANHTSWIRYTPLIFLSALFIVLPFLARIEEDAFRRRNHKWRDTIWNSIGFGLIHCLAGVPLGAGIALIGTGLFYAIKYRKEYYRQLRKHRDKETAEEMAVLESVTYHTLYNSFVFVLIFTSLILKLM